MTALGDNLVGRMATGTYVGTGADLSIALEFAPRAVLLLNKSAAASLWWTRGMGDGAGLLSVTAGTNSFITSGGVTPQQKFERDDASPVNHGFTIGDGADLNTSSEVGEYIAWE